jgi:hypothetical protein
MTHMDKDEGYQNEFDAPIYTTLDRRTIGDRVITTVVIDGEVAEFEIGTDVAESIKELTNQEVQQFTEEMNARFEEGKS